eukprot:gene2623-24255_t
MVSLVTICSGLILALSLTTLHVAERDAAAAGDPRCRLDGNWTDGTNKTRIEIFQPPAFNYLSWRSSKYIGAFSEGRIDPARGNVWDHSGWLLLYETQTQAKISIGKSDRVPNADDCSMIKVNGEVWCRFPFCGFPQPNYRAWPFPSLDPDHPSFPPPKWAPNYNLTESTALQPGAGQMTRGGLFEPKHPWGLITLGSDYESTAATVANCRSLKAAGNAAKCFIYHNWERALGWIESQKKVMVDASKKSYFIQWPNGSIYNQTIGSGLQYVWNFSNPAAADYVISSTLADLADPAVDGSYMDDGPYGMPLENPFILQNINMSIATLAAYQKAAVMSYVKVMSGMVAAHKYSYQEMGWYGQYAAISQTQCSSFMRELCKPEMQNHPLMMHAQSAPGSTVVLNQTIAAFLIARPPVAFIGFPWPAQDSQWSSKFLLDAGNPTGPCMEKQPNTFTRQWSNGEVELDCAAWEAVLPFESLHHYDHRSRSA